jgi:hypothetical protein
VEVGNVLYEHPHILATLLVDIFHGKSQNVSREVEFGDLPKTATGKIQKNKLRERK